MLNLPPSSRLRAVYVSDTLHRPQPECTVRSGKLQASVLPDSAHLDGKHDRQGDDAAFRVGTVGEGTGHSDHPNVFRLHCHLVPHCDYTELAENSDRCTRRCQREISILFFGIER